jgi:hypothetical protein
LGFKYGFQFYLDVQIKQKSVPSPVERARERLADLPLSLTLSPRARGD